MTFEAFLQRFPRAKRNSPTDYHLPCPGHDDHAADPNRFSLHATLAGDRILLKCFAGCTTDQVLRALQLTAADLFTTTNGHGHAQPAPDRSPEVTPTLALFSTLKRIPQGVLEVEGWRNHDDGLAIPYKTRDGSLWRMRYRTSLRPGAGFKWDGQKDRPLIPYGRHRLDQIMEKGELWLVEGESDSVTAWARGLPCLGLPGNLAVKALTTEDLVGIEKLWIVLEPGASGEGFARKLRERLVELDYGGLASLVTLPAKDLSDLHVLNPSGFWPAIRACQEKSRDLATWGPSAPDTVSATDGPPYIESLADFLADEDPPGLVVFPELLPHGVIMLIHGDPRARKSLTAFELALAAATGTAPFGLERFSPAAPIPVLYIQEEDPRTLTRPRLRRLVAERCGDTLPGTLHVAVRRGVDLDDPSWVDRLIADLQRLGAGLLVLDAARRFSIKTDEGPAKVRELIAVLRRLVTTAGVSIAIVHHDVKPPAAGQDLRRRGQRASGGDWFAGCECPVHVERINERESLVYPQDYKFSADPAPFTFTVELDGRLIKHLVGRETTTERAETAGARGKLLDWIRLNGPASKTAMKRAGFGWETLTPVLDGLLKDGAVDAMKGRTAKSLIYFATDQPSSLSQDSSHSGQDDE
jgi:AAA domain